MARPLRIEFPGALYHVVSRGHRHEAVYDDDDVREMFLDILAEAVQRQDSGNPDAHDRMDNRSTGA